LYCIYEHSQMNFWASTRTDAAIHDLHILVNIASRPKVSFTDDCSIYYITRDKIGVSLAEDNFPLKVELKLNEPHVLLWARMIATQMLDHSNLAILVNASCYVELLDVRLTPQLRDKGTSRNCAPAHIAHSVQGVLNKQCLGCCSPTSPVSLHRPPRVPDLITRVKSLFHCVTKVQPAAQCCRKQ